MVVHALFGAMAGNNSLDNVIKGQDGGVEVVLISEKEAGRRLLRFEETGKVPVDHTDDAAIRTLLGNLYGTNHSFLSFADKRLAVFGGQMGVKCRRIRFSFNEDDCAPVHVLKQDCQGVKVFSR